MNFFPTFFLFLIFADAFCGIRGSSFAGQAKALEDGALGADQRRRAARHHRARPRDGGRVRPLLRHGHRLLRSGARLPATSDGHQRLGTRAAVGAGRLVSQQQPLVGIHKLSFYFVERQSDVRSLHSAEKKLKHILV